MSAVLDKLSGEETALAPTAAAPVGAGAMKALLSGERFVVDGEVVAFDGAQTSFGALAQRGRKPVKVFLYLFDVLWLDGRDVRGLPLLTRKKLLKAALQRHEGVRLTPHRRGDGEAYFAEACSKGWEGLIAKRADSAYTSARSKDWLKFKCERGQEMVIGGYTPPKGSRIELGALLVGHYEDGELRYAGRVGTGFDEDTLRDLGERLRSAERGSKIYLDVNHIAYAQHAVSPYSPRARDRAPVAAPIHWEELSDSKLKPDRFTIKNIGARIDSEGDPWKGMDRRARKLPPATSRLGPRAR